MAVGAGAYGKIPALGDFFRVDLPPGFTRPWDAWLQGQLLHARRRLGEAWGEAYNSAPIWRFTLAAGLAGPWAAQGVMMPSVDRVGRSFPLTLARVPAPVGAVLASHLAAEPAFAALEDLALEALEDHMSRETLAAGLAALPPFPPGPQATPSPSPPVSGEAQPLALALAAGTGGFAALARHPGLQRAAVFTAELNGQALILAAHGLPEPQHSLLFFDPAQRFLQAAGPGSAQEEARP